MFDAVPGMRRGDDDDGVEAATSDGAGGLYLSGYTRGSLGGPNAGELDAWVARYDGRLLEALKDRRVAPDVR